MTHSEQIHRNNSSQTTLYRQRALLPAAALVLFMLGGLALLLWRTPMPAARQQGLPLATLSAGDFHALAFLPDKEEVVLFGHHNGIMRSDDGGRTWTTLIEQRGFDAMSILVRDTVPPQIAVAGHHIFQASWDGGQTWQSVSHSLPSNDIHALVMNPDRPEQLTVYVAGEGLFSSFDGGRSWDRLAGQPAVVKDTMTLASAGGDPETLYLGTLRSGLWRSQDGGVTWAELGWDSQFGSILALAVDPLARTTLYVGTNRGLFKSTDGGNTWTQLPYPGQNAAVVALHPRKPATLLAISVTSEGMGSLYRSDDGGRSWSDAP
ncbi:MAG: S-layer protein [Herpetosiphonaceae bacterium]|nr:MAG: S-layer protein [Herpetosiphonaceae bacterium]